MFVVRNYVTMGGTVFCALAIGYLMQNGSAAQPDTGETRHAMAATSGEGAVIAGLQGIVLTSSSPSRTAAMARPFRHGAPCVPNNRRQSHR